MPLFSSIKVDINDKEQMEKIVKSTIGTKFIKKWYGCGWR